MTISKKSTLLSCVIIIAVLVSLAASYISASKIALASGALAIAAAFFYVCLIKYEILKPLKEISSTIENISVGGDLTQRLKQESDDEIGVIAKSFNGLMDEVMKTMAEARNASVMMTRALSETALNMDASYERLQEVSDNVKGLSSNAAEQARGAEGFEEISAELLKGCCSLSARISEAAAALDKIMLNKEKGEQKLSALMENNDAEAEKNKKTARELGGLTSQIASTALIADEIKTAAGQARLLSHGAWTEAANAGEQCEGFAAVFETVSRLTGQAADAALKIEKLIASMNPINAEAVMEALKIPEGQNVYVKEIREVFSGISSEINAANSVFGGIHQSLAAMTPINVKIREAAREIHEIGLENKRGAESAEEAVKLQANAVEKAKALSHRTASAMKELEGTFDRFKVNTDEPV